MHVSPILVSPQNAWSLQDVCFTDAECRDYISRFCERFFKGMNKEDASCLEQYVRNLTEGHPGFVTYFMRSIQTQFRQELKYPKNTKELSWAMIFEYFKSHSFCTIMMNVSVFSGFKVT